MRSRACTHTLTLPSSLSSLSSLSWFGITARPRAPRLFVLLTDMAPVCHRGFYVSADAVSQGAGKQACIRRTFFSVVKSYCTPTSQLYVRTRTHRDANIWVDVHPGGPSLSARQDNCGVELDAGVMLGARDSGSIDWRVASWAGFTYTLGVFAFAFAVGTIRVTLVAPRLGTLLAVIIEAPIVLAVSWRVSLCCIRRFNVSRNARARILWEPQPSRF